MNAERLEIFHGLTYRYCCDDILKSGPIDDLADLLEVLRLGGDVTYYTLDGRTYGMDGLPTFGGAEPDDTDCVWSWDEKSLIVGTCSDDFRIVHRAEREAGA